MAPGPSPVEWGHCGHLPKRCPPSPSGGTRRVSFRCTVSCADFSHAVLKCSISVCLSLGPYLLGFVSLVLGNTGNSAKDLLRQPEPTCPRITLNKQEKQNLEFRVSAAGLGALLRPKRNTRMCGGIGRIGSTLKQSSGQTGQTEPSSWGPETEMRF